MSDVNNTAPAKRINRTKSIICGVMAFFLSLSLLAVTALITVDQTLFSMGYMESCVTDRFLDKLRDETILAAKDYTIPTNIDPDVIDGTFDHVDLRTDVIGCLAAYFDGGEYVPELTRFGEELTKNVDEFFEDNDQDITDDKQEIIAQYVVEIKALYAKEIKLIGIGTLMRLRAKFKKMFLIGVTAGCVLAAALIAAILKMHQKRIYRAMRFFAYAAGAAAIMTFSAPFYLLQTGFYQKLNIRPESFYIFMTTYLKGALESFIPAAACWLGVMLICIVLVVILKHFNKAKQ